MKFRKKPVVIDAARVSDVLEAAAHRWKDLPDWIEAAYNSGGLVFGNKTAMVRTLEGTMDANLNDWIIRGVKGELYPCKPDIFEATYEPAGE